MLQINQHHNNDNEFHLQLYLTKFGCPSTLVTNQGVHDINDAIKHLTKHFMLKHVISTTYYPHGNG
jgi:hypothetical protein